VSAGREPHKDEGRPAGEAAHGLDRRGVGEDELRRQEIRARRHADHACCAPVDEHRVAECHAEAARGGPIERDLSPRVGWASALERRGPAQTVRSAIADAIEGEPEAIAARPRAHRDERPEDEVGASHAG
jgi:hypothetical protein